MQYSFFHWGLHAWAIYAVVALAVAYFNFRKDKPGLISAVLSPLLGDRANGPIGKAIDTLAILATLFGVAVSLGLGTLQIGAGLGESLGVPNGIGHAADHHRRHHGRLLALGVDRDQQRGQLPEPGEHLPGRRFAALLYRPGTDGRPAQRLHAGYRRLCRRAYPDELHDELL
jgi:hypothetical protein